MTPVGKEIFGVDVLVRTSAETTVFSMSSQPAQPSQNIQQMHRDYVPALPPSFHLLGSTAMTTNHGMVKYTSASSSKGAARPLTDIHILTVQGHPEYTEPIVATMINFREASGVLDAQTAEDARRRVGCRNDGVVFGRAIWGVLGVV
jgi:GMP synthase-like glutamine amidotransferase